MAGARFARVVRFCAERFTTRADGLASAAGHFAQWRFKSQCNDAEKRQSGPYRCIPIVAVGSHGGRGLVMFGVCRSSWWAPNPEPTDAQRYPMVIDVVWERTSFEVDSESFPSRPGRSFV